MTSRGKGAVAILFAAAIAALPVLRGLAAGDDFQFHLLSWLDAQQAWRHGIPYPHWAASANYGAGEPRFLFYPPLTWMLGAALGLLLPWKLVPAAMLFVLLGATGFAVRKLAREALPEAQSALAGCIAILSGYALYTAYARAAFAELAGGFWIPLVLLYALPDNKPKGDALHRAMDGSTVPLALIVAGSWLSNVPVGIMASYLLLGVALAAAWQARSVFPLIRAASSGVVGLGLSAIYLVPAAWEQRFVNPAEITDLPIFRIENHWLLPWHSDPALAVHGTGLGFIAMLLAAPLLGVIAFAVQRDKPESLASPRWWIVLGSLPVVVLLLHLPISTPIWQWLPRLRFLQFPWRWLLVLEAPTGIFLASAMWPRSSATRWQRVVVCSVCAAMLLASVAFAIERFLLSRDQSGLPALLAAYRSGAGLDGLQEYAARGWDNSLIATGLPDACLGADPQVVLGAGGTSEDNPHWTADQGSCLATSVATQRTPEHQRFSMTNSQPGYLILRLRSYPAWRVAVYGKATATIARSKDGLIAIPVPAGPISVSVDWITSADVIAGRLISALSLILLVALLVDERRRTP